MTYSERLAALGEGFTQLSVGSLGKAVDRTGRRVEWGQTAIRARGSADQHSHLQLYLEGPRDKVVVFLRVENHGDSLTVPATYQDLEDVACLGGQSLGAVLNAEQTATEFALARRGRPSITVGLPAVTPFTVGQLLYLFEPRRSRRTSLADVDPFSQPPSTRPRRSRTRSSDGPASRSSRPRSGAGSRPRTHASSCRRTRASSCSRRAACRRASRSSRSRSRDRSPPAR
jgi:hypothetical protein